MTANDALLILLGIVFGCYLGWASAWRFARKLEFHGVKLVEWDTERIDYGAKSGRVLPHSAGRNL